MNNKLSLLYIALILFTSHVSSALVLNDHNLVYFGIQYKPARHHLSNLLIKESKSDVVEVLALKYDAIGSPLDSTKEVNNFTIKYNPHYDNNRLGFSVIFGYYYNKNFRIESEISHEIFQLKNEGHKRVGFEKYFALKFAPPSSTQGYRHVTLINNGISTTSALINACYDVLIPAHNIITYSCLGFGIDIVDFLSKYTTKFSHQGKLGASYPISHRMSVFTEVYYHGLFGKKFEQLPLNYNANTSPPQQPPHVHTTASAILSIGYYGGSVGIKFIL
ncbi:P44/Msp2 family outer membrane protein [Ehrlichia canis]|uniref:Surface antigen msp4 n=2 Tax=Ehrlichia canis TaxID=944 RepID=A0ACA6AX54_EHRCJ|nr:P44/Msp2 family outer membrane protein [Ehrlichia canis]AAK28681.1 major outer membrane protein P30-18 [Ehrlichia canis]AAZ68927.1 Surface antigen msp4 [Ehrlichia canis str. Jake]